jgi:hypothetical protein
MSNFEVEEPIINTPFDKPTHFWYIREGSSPEKREGRRPSVVYPPSDTNTQWELGSDILSPSREFAPGYEMLLVNTIRERLKAWREQNYPGITRTTRELIEWWRREGRKWRLFYAPLEAVETLIFLREARPDLRQGINVPLDQPSEKQLSEGAKRSPVSAGLLRIKKEECDKEGNLVKVHVEVTRYLESDGAWTQRVIGREIGGKENILVMNDEAHHAYRIKREVEDASETAGAWDDC